MVFPATPVGVKVEIDLVGGWTIPTDISSFCMGRDDLTITRGRSAEGNVADPGVLNLTLNNRDGRFSPRNPTGPYYGKLGRNTPIRVSVPGGNIRGFSPVFDTGGFTTPDSVANSIVGDIDLRIDMRPMGWRWNSSVDPAGSNFRNLMVKSGGAGNLSWTFDYSNDGRLSLQWSTTGAGSVYTNGATSTLPVPLPVTGRRAVRVTLDVDNGAAGNTVVFYTAPTIAGPWVQLGAAQITAGITSIFNSNGAPQVTCAYKAEVYSAEIRNGIGGAVANGVDFTAGPNNTTIITGSAGETWSGLGQTRATNTRQRFYGEVANWPQRWDETGRDIYTQVQATGILRRLNQGATALRSTLYRGISNIGSSLMAYWPAEDDDNSVQVAAGLPSGRPMKVNGTPDFAAYSSFVASAPIPTLNSSAWAGEVPPYVNTNQWQVRFLLAVPAAGTTNSTVVARMFCTGTAIKWEVAYTTGGNLGLQAFDRDDNLVYNSGAVAFAVNGKRLQVSVEVVESGANVIPTIKTIQDDGTNGLFNTGSLLNQSVDRIYRVMVNPNGTLTDTAIGHVYVQNTTTNLYDLANQLRGWASEKAADRIARLCTEEGLQFRIIGESLDSEPMGPQLSANLVDLLKQAAETDLGQFGESRVDFGVMYRTRAAMLRSTPVLTLDYHSKHLSSLEPVDDDANIANDITVTRADGSNYRIAQTSGALNITEPSAGGAGVGRYPDSATINTYTDVQLRYQAGWRLRMGTVDEARYPSIGVDLSRSPFVASTALAGAVVDVDTGDIVQVTGPPTWVGSDTISQIVRGIRETMSNFTHLVEFVGDPASPYSQVAASGDAVSRYSPNGSTLTAAATSTATSLTVTMAAGPLWTTDVTEFPFDIIVAGERMTVTAITGVASPQTFTVTRSVNGVVKAQVLGATVELFDPVYYSL